MSRARRALRLLSLPLTGAGGRGRQRDRPRRARPPSGRSRASVFPRSVESPSLGLCTDVLLPHLLEDDLGQLSDLEPEPDTQNWQHTVGKDVAAGLSQREVDRQEVINGEGAGGRRAPVPGSQWLALGTGPGPCHPSERATAVLARGWEER